MSFDIKSQPEVEYDDSGDGSLTISWFSHLYQQSFSLVLHDGSLIGVHSSAKSGDRIEPWKIDLPKGLVKIDCTVIQKQVR